MPEETPQVIAVGDVMIDVSVEAGMLERGGDVHGDIVLRPGGSATNAAVWAASRGAPTRLHGRVGDDIAGRLLAEAVAERGVEPALVRDPESRTGTVLAVRQGGERSMVAHRGANARLSPSDLPDRLKGGAVLVSGYLLFHPDSEPAALASLERADAEHVAVDAASWPLIRDYGVGAFLEATARATLLLANQLEADTLAPGSPEDSAGALSKRYRRAVVKLDGGGAVVGERGEVSRIPAPRAEPADPTGAGDAFAGVLLAELTSGAPPEEALRRAAAAAATAVASPSAWPERR